MTATLDKTPEAIFADIQQDFSRAADKPTADGMAKYMRFKFDFYGVKSPTRKELTKRYKSDFKFLSPDRQIALAKMLWAAPQRELQYLAIDLLSLTAKKPSLSHLPFYEYLITTKSWWDTVDAIASNLVGPYFLCHPVQRDMAIDQWMTSGNIWLQRTCLIFQLKYKSETDRELLFGLVDSLKESDAFFIKKAIGWSLRQYAKTNPDEVRTFVARTPLKPLSRKEALKHL